MRTRNRKNVNKSDLFFLKIAYVLRLIEKQTKTKTQIVYCKDPIQIFTLLFDKLKKPFCHVQRLGYQHVYSPYHPASMFYGIWWENVLKHLR